MPRTSFLILFLRIFPFTKISPCPKKIAYLIPWCTLCRRYLMPWYYCTAILSQTSGRTFVICGEGSRVRVGDLLIASRQAPGPRPHLSHDPGPPHCAQIHDKQPTKVAWDVATAKPIKGVRLTRWHGAGNHALLARARSRLHHSGPALASVARADAVSLAVPEGGAEHQR